MTLTDKLINLIVVGINLDALTMELESPARGWAGAGDCNLWLFHPCSFLCCIKGLQSQFSPFLPLSLSSQCGSLLPCTVGEVCSLAQPGQS